MFSVIFEVQPQASQWNNYLETAKSLKPSLEKVPGFVRNIRYRSLQRDGWILSLSDWQDEKALVRWRTRPSHHHAQENGRQSILADYHLRVGQVAADDNSGHGGQAAPSLPRGDLTEVGDGPVVSLLERTIPPDQLQGVRDEELARSLGLALPMPGLLSWDLFDAVLSPGDVILLCTWRDEPAAWRFVATLGKDLEQPQSHRVVRVIRDYGKYDRREAPQYYPDVPGGESLHA